MKPKKNKEKKEPKFSEIKNLEPSVRVLEDEELPETRQIIKIEKMDMPLTTVEEAKLMWKQYQDLMVALMKESDVVDIQGKKKIKKSGVNKIARFFGYSVEILRTKKEEIIGPQGGRQFVWYAWVKAIAPNGRFRVEGSACSSTERRFAHLYHDVLATAITRASNRAIQELAGMGELELTEDEDGQDTENEPETPLMAEQSDKTAEKKWAVDDRETMERPTGQEGITEFGIDPEGWKPMFKARAYPSNPKIAPSGEQIKWIKSELEKMGLRPEYAVFKLNNRNDKNIVDKYIADLTKGDAFDLCCAINKKGKFAELVSEVVPIEENEQASQGGENP